MTSSVVGCSGSVGSSGVSGTSVIVTVCPSSSMSLCSVTFEELYDLSNEDEPVKVAEHKDIDDEGQTVLITERHKKLIEQQTTSTEEMITETEE